VTLLLNRELVSRAKFCLVSFFPDIVKDCPKIRNLPEIFLRSFQNVAPDFRQQPDNYCWTIEKTAMLVPSTGGRGRLFPAKRRMKIMHFLTKSGDENLGGNWEVNIFGNLHIPCI